MRARNRFNSIYLGSYTADATHILRLKCAKKAGDKDDLRMKFSALNVDFSSPSPDPVRLKRPAHASVKEGYLLKSGYFTTIGSARVKAMVNMRRLAAYRNKH